MSHRVELEREDYEALCERAAKATDPDRERIEFIRRAAIALFQVAVPDREGSADHVWTEAGCWHEARKLWEAKPDDC